MHGWKLAASGPRAAAGTVGDVAGAWRPPMQFQADRERRQAQWLAYRTQLEVQRQVSRERGQTRQERWRMQWQAYRARLQSSRERKLQALRERWRPRVERARSLWASPGDDDALASRLLATVCDGATPLAAGSLSAAWRLSSWSVPWRGLPWTGGRKLHAVQSTAGRDSVVSASRAPLERRARSLRRAATTRWTRKQWRGHRARRRPRQPEKARNIRAGSRPSDPRRRPPVRRKLPRLSRALPAEMKTVASSISPRPLLSPTPEGCRACGRVVGEGPKHPGRDPTEQPQEAASPRPIAPAAEVEPGPDQRSTPVRSSLGRGRCVVARVRRGAVAAGLALGAADLSHPDRGRASSSTEASFARRGGRRRRRRDCLDGRGHAVGRASRHGALRRRHPPTFARSRGYGTCGQASKRRTRGRVRREE